MTSHCQPVYNEPLFKAYPDLCEAIDALCEHPPWCITGVSALVCYRQNLILEITKPKHWAMGPEGTTLVGLGGIGGSLLSGEPLLQGLQRELLEEIRSTARISSAREAILVYEEKHLTSLRCTNAGYPLPVLLTISRNRYRRQVLPEYKTLVIVTFWAEVRRPPTLGDLYGFVSIPWHSSGILERNSITPRELEQLAGARVVTRSPLPQKTTLKPVWTGRSLQLTLQNDMLNVFGDCS